MTQDVTQTADTEMSPKMMNLPSKGDKKRVVIIGGGFGGLKFARSFVDKDFQVVLIDRSNHHIFQPLLYQVTAAAIPPSTVSFPFRKVFHGRKDFHFRMCTALSVDPEKRVLTTSIGDVDYDYLVIATGVDTNYFGNAELAETTMGLKTTSEALYNRNHILKSLEKAENTHDADERARLLTFVVVGAGATGVEMVGALAEMRKFVLPRDYPDLDINAMRIILINSSDRVLPSFKEESSQEASDYLRKRKVELMMNTRVNGYKNGLLELSSGTIPTANVFWTAGVIAHPIEGLPKDVYGHGNRIIVDEFNRVKGVDRIFCIGDGALLTCPEWPHGYPQVAQPALQQAVNTVYNIKQAANNQPLRPFVYNDRGSMATIGRHHAVVELKHFSFGGFFGWFVWLVIHLMNIVGVQNRLILFIDWLWHYITYDSSLRIIIQPLFRRNLLECPNAEPKRLGQPKEPKQETAQE